ncbi:hypothetical protein CQ12_10715 [Bradyrhizobium jicamae]|uniref:Uncharacterized protein n=1 Tax=Bradyrhizobium jicamae TaxID=280332 RepID=A0A0R3M2X4_9BRAD|nr:hypothetical protein [Bradyrhizobium jicamae]KRR14596.1 hypothetical protein CQ12_10715 [Bradyrhizobium jicamae]
MNDIFSPETWDWLSTVWKAAVGAGIGTAAVQGGVALYRDRTQKNEKAAYLALRLAVLLEGYASKCCDFYFDNLNAAEPQDEPYPAWRTDLPEMPELPDDTEAWRAMDKKLLAKCLEFPNRVRASQNAIESCAEYTMDDLGVTLDEQASARGVEACEIAASLRSTYKLGRAEPVFDYYSRLLQVLKTSKQQREEREKSQAEFLRELSARESSFPG